ncbi:MAG: type IX secretion system membrane protein PorP/SprF [Flavobacteriaceae bacterium]|nr:type IX secretion system membrane protein PorP/SprF [Muriicola sp.]NNC61891.1 type IX secretion system membrane protein PorP/SprF [Eudoraea sp.]NNK20120.1 type IX secretion system membrane protein PorP/SprF [Flavobacteriaceae bacterium]MBT8289523.1 type IX secretion system membrane protein PorP/SprF [Muriicola sp.]NNK34716.1 type IX secretion system membrane protein PorP/SprF [Eudoraea sp.]
MRKSIVLGIIMLSVMFVKGQELTLPQLSQYLADNPFVMSPTYAGIGDHIKVRINGLTQWVGIEDAPDTQSLAADARIGNKSGLGMLLYNDSNGETKQRGARLSFAHHLTLDRYDDEFVSFGISYNFNQFRIDIENFDGPDPNVTDDRATTNHNFDVGVLYRKDKFYFSLNASNLLDKDLSNFNPVFEPNRLRNYYIYTGYRYTKNKNSRLEIEPSVFFQWFESDGRSVTDLNVKFRWYDFEDYYYAGVTYRFLNDQIGSPLYIAPIMGLKKSNFYFGYSYQIILNEILGFSTGTHVVTLGVDLFQGLSNCRCTY